MNRTNAYENAVQSLVSKMDVSEAACALLKLAYDCDRLQRNLVENARLMSERFAAYAAEVECAVHNRSTPHGDSALADIATDAAKLEAKRETLLALANVVLGAGASKQILVAARAILESRPSL